MTNLHKVKGWGYSGRQYSLLLCQYLDREHNDANYMRIMRILKGEVEPTEQEVSAMEAFEHAQQNPHSAGVTAYRLRQNKDSFEVLLRYAKSGIFNTTATQNTIKKLMRML